MFLTPKNGDTKNHLDQKQDQNLIIARGNLRWTFSYYIFVPHFVQQKSIIGSLPRAINTNFV